MYAEETVVEHRGERKRLEGLDACFIDVLRVFADACVRHSLAPSSTIGGEDGLADIRDGR